MIIGTSFAPSPTLRVISGPFLFAKATTSDFYLGDTLQHITEFAWHPNLKKRSARAKSSRTIVSVEPSITMDIFE